MNDSTVSKEEYRKFISENLNIPLYGIESIFFQQGKLEASPYIKGGEELTKHLEKVCGSYTYKKEYEEVERRTKNNEQAKFEISKEIIDIRKQRNKLKKMEGYMEDSRGVLDEREAIAKQIEDCELISHHKEIQTLKEELTEIEKSINDSVKSKEKLLKAIRKILTGKINSSKTGRAKEDEFRKIEGVINTLKADLKAKESSIEHSNFKLKAIDALISKNNTSIRLSKEGKRALDQEINKLESAIQDIEKKEEEMLKSEEGQKDKKIKDQYFEIKGKVQEKTAQMQLDISAEARMLERINMMVMMKISKRDDLIRKIKEIEFKIKNTTENQAEEREMLDKLELSMGDLKLSIEQDTGKRKQLTNDIGREEREALVLKGEILTFEEDKQLRREERKIKDALEQLKRDEKGYHGFFYELINPIQSKYQIAIKVALQSVLRLIVVDSIDTAKRVDEYLTEKGLYLDLLILEKIPQDTQFNNIHSKRRKLEGRGHMIADVVD